MSIFDLSEQEIIRRNSMNELRNMGIDPYPAAEFKVNAYTTEMKENSATRKNHAKWASQAA